MIRPVLRIIFDYKYHTLLPDTAPAEMFDKQANGIVIVGHMRLGCRTTQAQAFGMVVSKADRIKLRHAAGAHHDIKFFFPLEETGCVAHTQIPPCKGWTHMTGQYGNVWFCVVGKLSVRSVRDTCTLAVIPNESVLIVGDPSVPFAVIITAPATVRSGPGFLKVVGCVGTQAPIMAIRGNFTVDIEIIKKHKLPGNGMLVGRHVFPKQHKA